MSLEDGTPEIGTDKESIIDFLGQDDNEGEDILKETPKEEPVEEEIEIKDEEDDELKEIEEELKEEEIPDEDELELIAPVKRREILKKYPTLFKDFPYLEKAYYRDRQFTELLPTIDDAKEAVAKSQTLDKFESDILQGNTVELLSTVKRFDENSFHKLVDNYLPNLHKADPSAYNHVVGNVFKMLIQNMVNESRNSGDESLQTAARVAHQFVFGNTQYTPPSNLSKEESKNPDADKLNKEREEFTRQRFQSIQVELSSKVENSLRSTLETHMDPNKNMTDYVRKNAVRDALNTLTELIQKDKSFVAINNKLWQRAFESNFSPDSVDKVRAAFLSKAKTLLPTVIKKARNEALKGSGKRASDDPKRGPIATGNPSTPKSSVKAVPKGMKTLDFLMQD